MDGSFGGSVRVDTNLRQTLMFLQLSVCWPPDGTSFTHCVKEGMILDPYVGDLFPHYPPPFFESSGLLCRQEGS